MFATAKLRMPTPAEALPGRAEPVTIGKKNQINNFCIGIQSNWPSCTSCHAGYGWTDGSYDFSDSTKVDCLVCHDRSGTYVKTKGGLPAEGVDLLAAARSVGSPGRDNCGGCHFSGGGGNAVKHGDLDATLLHPTERRDVHMGRYGFVCTDCHRTEQHVIAGRAMSVSVDDAGGAACTDCHAPAPHGDARLDGHTGAVACQTCHIPEMAVDEATKVHWDWSQAGQDLPEDVHTYLKIKGRFVYEQGLQPVYRWSDGSYLEDQDHWRLSGIHRDVLAGVARRQSEKGVTGEERVTEAHRNVGVGPCRLHPPPPPVPAPPGPPTTPVSSPAPRTPGPWRSTPPAPAGAPRPTSWEGGPRPGGRPPPALPGW